jgi:amidase
LSDEFASGWPYASLAETRAVVVNGGSTARALTERYLQRIDALQPTLRPYARARHERALAEADALDKLQASGAALGPLHGVPVAVKDLLYLEGERTASGTVVMADFRPGYTATVVHRLRAAGAVIIGQTQLTEGAFGLHHPQLVAPRNPWATDYWPGVSSSGSGVAVAAGMAVAALGTDTGGSIRFPAACCGLVGLKPTYGRVSVHGAWALGPTLDHIGPITRSVADAATVLEVLAGADPKDAGCLPEPAPRYSRLAGAKDLSGWRIGYDPDYATRGVDAQVTERLRAVRELLLSLGAQLVPIMVPDSARELVAAWSESCGYECAQVHAELFQARADDYGPALRSLIQIGQHTSKARYEALERVRRQFRDALETAFGSMDLLLTPTLPRTVPTVAVAEGAAVDDRGRADYLTFTAPFDFSGHPTLTLPAGVERQSSPAGQALPCSVQLIAAQRREDQLIVAGQCIETALNAAFGALYRDDLLPPAAATAADAL